MGLIFRERGKPPAGKRAIAAAIVLAIGVAIGGSSCHFGKNADIDADAPAKTTQTPGDYGEVSSIIPSETTTSSMAMDGAEEGAADAPDAQADADQPDDSRQDIPWQFFAYSEPDFASKKLGSMPPSKVEIIERRGDGWALIDAGGGSAWVYLDRNLVYLDRWVSLYSEVGDSIALGDQSPQMVEIIEQNDNWIRIISEHGACWVDMNSIRQAVLLDVPSYDQRELGYPLGCEMVALAMMMNYETEVSVHDLVDEMPRADHPDEGFRGEPSSSNRGWTIFPPALTGMMIDHMGSSYDMSELEMVNLREQLNENKPVLVWVSGLGWAVHALCLTGYDESGFYYNDPWTGQKDTPISYGDFYEIWNKPIYDRVLDLTYAPRKALSY